MKLLKRYGGRRRPSAWRPCPIRPCDYRSWQLLTHPVDMVCARRRMDVIQKENIFMAIFSKHASSKIDASKRRVTALWFGDVERVMLTDGTPLTGTAVMVAIYTLSGFYQYYVILYALSNRVVEIWKIAAENVPITSAPECEFGLFRALRNKNIELTQVPVDSPQFVKLLSRLPLAFDDDNMTQPNAKLYMAPGSENTGVVVSDDEKVALRHFLICE